MAGVLSVMVYYLLSWFTALSLGVMGRLCSVIVVLVVLHHILDALYYSYI